MGSFAGGLVEETDSQRERFAIADEMYSDYITDYAPVENQNALLALDSKGYRRELETGLATAGAKQAVDASQEAIEKAQLAGGLNPNSGKFKASMAGDEGAAIVAGAGINADMANEDAHLNKVASAINLGNKNQGLGLHALSTSAGLDAADERARAQAAAMESSAAVQAGTTAATLAALNYKPKGITEDDLNFDVQKQSRVPTPYEYDNEGRPIWKL